MIKLTYVASGQVARFNPKYILVYYKEPTNETTWVCIASGHNINVQESCETIDDLIKEA